MELEVRYEDEGVVVLRLDPKDPHRQLRLQRVDGSVIVGMDIDHRNAPSFEENQIRWGVRTFDVIDADESRQFVSRVRSLVGAAGLSDHSGDPNATVPNADLQPVAPRRARDESTKQSAVARPTAAASYSAPRSGGSSAAIRFEFTRVARLALIVQVLAYVVGILAMIGAVFIAFEREPSCDALRASCSFTESFPNFWFGVLIGLLAMFQVSIVVLVSAYFKARSTEALERNKA